jgi:outer membrane protein insertion porin family
MMGRAGFFNRLSGIFLLFLLLAAVPARGGGMPGEGEGAVPARPPSALAGFHVRVDPPEGAAKPLAEMAESLLALFLREGSPLDGGRLDEALKALRETRRFADVRLEREELPGGIVLTFYLKALPRVRDIRIHGNFPLFESDVRSVMTLSPGDGLPADGPAKEGERIAERFRKEGFIRPEVAVEVLADREALAADLDVTIRKGRNYFLRDLVFQGNRAFDGGTLEWRMETWRAHFFAGLTGRFRPGVLRRDMEALTAFYRGRGFADVRLEEAVSMDEKTGGVDVRVTVAEGDRYEVSFEGNRAFGDSALRKDMVLFREGNSYGLGVLRSVSLIRERYRNAGFLQVRVTPETEREGKDGEGIRRVRFRIDEGPQTLVESVALSGNTVFPGERLKEEILTRPPGWFHAGAFVPEILGEDVRAVRSLYGQEGYRCVEVLEDLSWKDDRRKVAVALNIREGPRTVVGEVAFPGLRALTEREALELVSMKPGESFREEGLRDDENALARAVSRKGYPHVRVRGEAAFGEDGKTARLAYRVEEGPPVTLGNVFFSGNFQTRTDLLRETMGLEGGTPFTLEAVFEGQRKLRNMGIFDSVQFQTFGLAEREERADLLVNLAEKKPYFVETSLGFQSDKRFYGKLSGGNRNLFGLNKKLRISAEWSETSDQYEIGITEPRLFGSAVSASVILFRERKTEFNQDFGTKSYGLSTGVSYPWTPQLTTGLGARLERKSRFPVGTAVLSEETSGEGYGEARDILTGTPSVTWDTRDSFLRPRKGLFSSLAADVSRGFTNSLDDFLKYRVDLRYYVTPWNRLTVALMGRAGYLTPYGKATSVPDDQLFYLGGAFSVRGYDENKLYYDAEGNAMGGRVSLMGSVEFRIDLGRDFEFDVFFDSGQLRQFKEDPGLPSVRSSVGFGLRYMTPVGPIGILYGVKLNRQDGESAGRFHLAVGYTF